VKRRKTHTLNVRAQKMSTASILSKGQRETPHREDRKGMIRYSLLDKPNLQRKRMRKIKGKKTYQRAHPALAVPKQRVLSQFLVQKTELE